MAMADGARAPLTRVRRAAVLGLRALTRAAHASSGHRHGKRRSGGQRAAGPLRLRRRPSVRSGPPRRLRARIRGTRSGRARAALEPRAATDEELRCFHTPEYVEFVRERSASGSGLLDGGDTPAFRGVFEAAAAVVGATLSAHGGHHARRSAGARSCRSPGCTTPRATAPPASACSTTAAWRSSSCKRAGLERIAYVDIDAHHGDGVFYAFEDDAAVIFADLHEDGRYLYPGTGAAAETGRGAAARHQAQCAAAARCRR